MPVVSLPSEKVPAPPSPNWMLLSVLSFLLCQKEATCFALSSTSAPLSIIRGLRPALARVRPAKNPAGPNPTITGLNPLLRRQAGISYSFFSYSVIFESEARLTAAASSPFISAAMLHTKKTLSFLRESIAFLSRVTFFTSCLGMPSFFAAMVKSSSSANLRKEVVLIQSGTLRLKRR